MKDALKLLQDNITIARDLCF